MKRLIVTAFQSVFTSASAGAFCCVYGYPIQLFLLANLLLYKNFIISIQVFLQFPNFLIYVAFSLIHQVHILQVIQLKIHTTTFCKTLLWYTIHFVIDCSDPLS